MENTRNEFIIAFVLDTAEMFRDHEIAELLSNALGKRVTREFVENIRQEFYGTTKRHHPNRHNKPPRFFPKAT